MRSLVCRAPPSSSCFLLGVKQQKLRRIGPLGEIPGAHFRNLDARLLVEPAAQQPPVTERFVWFLPAQQDYQTVTVNPLQLSQNVLGSQLL